MKARHLFKEIWEYIFNTDSNLHNFISLNVDLTFLYIFNTDSNLHNIISFNVHLKFLYIFNTDSNLHNFILILIT